jgi:hypothetical protein
MKIVAVVIMNKREAYVFDEIAPIVYTKHKDAIIGTNEILYSFYYHEYPLEGFQAFAGRKFDILLDNGEIEHCSGQWWDGTNNTILIKGN